MDHNDSHKFESAFLGLVIPPNNSVMFSNLAGSKLGIWVAHGEGKFNLPEGPDKYNIVAQYNYRSYPGNPNGSPRGIAVVWFSSTPSVFSLTNKILNVRKRILISIQTE